MAKNTRTLLPILEAIDNFTTSSLGNDFVPFYLSLEHRSPQDIIGQVAINVLKEMLARDTNTLCTFPEDSHLHDSRSLPEAVAFQSHLNTPALRSQAIEKLALSVREVGLFADAIGGRKWRNELYTIYVHPFKNIGLEENIAFAFERSACELFGLITYGVHMTMYLPDYRIWVPRRSRTKQTWPGMLDNSVAGGIPHGMTPFESMVKECEEEASLSEEISRKSVKAAGAVSYFFQNSRGNLQPEIEYVYDMLCPSADDPAYIPKPLDGEVESFELMSWEEVVKRMLAGEFKRNSALVLVDFLMRHGKITPENEPNYLEIMTRMHGRFGLSS
ncbi:NUDIX family hydrolase [Ceratobasidium sp. AG-Ba]|nr:NUDIX family hydrolase [Ceratobasidium sp. AG-Ba]